MDGIAKLVRVWQSFTGRMLLVILGIHIILIPILFYGIFFLIEQNLKSGFVDQIRTTTFLYSSLIKNTLARNDSGRLRELLDELVLSSDIVFAEYVDSNSNTFIPLLPVNSSNLEFKEDYYFAANDDGIYFISLDILGDKDNRYLGELRLGYDESPIETQIITAYRYGIVIALCYFLVSVILAYLLGRRLVQPVAELRDISRKIASGMENTPMQINTSIAEIKYLANDFETMRDILVARNKDITNREKRLAAILNNASDGIISMDEHGIIQSFNKKAEEIFGYPESYIRNKHVSLLMPEEHASRHDDYVLDYMKTGIGKIMGTGRRLWAKHRNGEPVPIFLNISNLVIDSESIFIGIVHDLSKEALLEARLSQFWNALQQCPVSIIITDINGNIEYVNPFFCKVTGYKSHEVIGRNPSILKSGKTADLTYDELWTTISNGGTWQGVLENRKKDGELYWESATISPVLDDENKITNYIAVKEDITERRIKDLMLQQSMKMEVVGQMTNGISHDFNNLLTIILGNLQFMQEIVDSDDITLKQTLINDALSAARDGSKLIKQLMLFSRNKESEVVPVSVSVILHKIERLLKRIIPADIKVSIRINEEHDDQILSDPDRLESAILNLAINARDAMPDGGEISISHKEVRYEEPREVEKGLVDRGHYISINVSDTGAGMSEEVKQRILEPFFTTKTDTAGTGLGLSMVYDFVTSAGGGISIQSKPNQGTSIDLILPAFIKSNASDISQTHSNETAYSGGNETILLVEDKERVRRFAHRALEKLGYSLLEASNADEALTYLKPDLKIDMLFSDIVMPGSMNGVELARQMKLARKSLKILLTTGIDLSIGKNEADGAEFPVLMKPYTIEKLATSIRNILDSPN